MEGTRKAFRTTVGLLFAAFFALLPLAAQAERVEDLPQPTDYVSDFAHVLSPDAVARLDALLSQLDQAQTHAKVAVVTIGTLDGDDAADYATRLEDHWKMGDKGENRFALLLVAVNDHKYRIETGYGLEGILPDGKTGDIGRGMVPLLRQGDYDGAVAGAVDEIAQTIAADAHVTLNGGEQEPVATHRTMHPGAALAKLIFIVILLIFFGGFSLLRMLFGFGLFFGGWGGGTWRGGGWGGGGGGFGGGDSGGGFGGFGGGGGGFGGGGAGGSW
jgi:uncharacterized protein